MLTRPARGRERTPALCFWRGPSTGSQDLSERDTSPWPFPTPSEYPQPDPFMSLWRVAVPPAECSGWVVMGALDVPLSQQTHPQQQWATSSDSEPHPELKDSLNSDSNSI